jgi:hypothetical protein
MIEAERTTETIEVGNSCMTTALEGTTGGIQRDNDDLESRCVKGRYEEFITINIMSREESFATWIVGKFISNAQASPKLIRSKGLIVTDELDMWAGSSHTVAIGLSISNGQVR